MRVSLFDDEVDLRSEDVLVQVVMPVVADVRFWRHMVYFRFDEAQEERYSVQKKSGRHGAIGYLAGVSCGEGRAWGGGRGEHS